MCIHVHLVFLLCSEDSSAHADLQITGKATNPYVVSPNKTLQAKTTTLSSAPTDETAIIRCVESIFMYRMHCIVAILYALQI